MPIFVLQGTISKVGSQWSFYTCGSFEHHTNTRVIVWMINIFPEKIPNLPCQGDCCRAMITVVSTYKNIKIVSTDNTVSWSSLIRIIDCLMMTIIVYFLVCLVTFLACFFKNMPKSNLLNLVLTFALNAWQWRLHELKERRFYWRNKSDCNIEVLLVKSRLLQASKIL